MNKNEIKDYYQKNKRKILPLTLILTIFLAWGFSIIREKHESGLIMSATLKQDCSIDYGYTKCYDGKLYIPFYNPNKKDITSLSLSVPVKTGTNIYNVNESLKVGVSSALPTIDCEKDVSTRNFNLIWCCNAECFKMEMNNPSKDVRVVIE